MKYLLIAAFAVVVGIAAFSSKENSYSVERDDVVDTATTTMEVVQEEWMTDQEAIEAAKAVVDRKRAEAELEAVQGEIELLRARETELEKELGTY